MIQGLSVKVVEVGSGSVAQGAALGEVVKDSGTIIQAQRKQIVRLLVRGRGYGVPGTSGGILSCYWAWASNNHPVLSMWHAHELHPFSRRERGFVLFCYLAFAFYVSTLFYGYSYPKQYTCKQGCQNIGPLDSCQESECEDYCGEGSGHNTYKTSVGHYEDSCDQYFHWYVLSVFIALCTVPYSQFLKALAQCGWVQECSYCCRKCCECLGSVFLGLLVLLSVLFLVLGIAESIDKTNASVMAAWMVGTVESWFYWPFLWYPVFYLNYRRSKRAFNKAFPGGYSSLAWPIDAQNLNSYDIKQYPGDELAVFSPLGESTGGSTSGSKRPAEKAKGQIPNRQPARQSPRRSIKQSAAILPVTFSPGQGVQMPQAMLVSSSSSGYSNNSTPKISPVADALAVVHNNMPQVHVQVQVQVQQPQHHHHHRPLPPLPTPLRHLPPLPATRHSLSPSPQRKSHLRQASQRQQPIQLQEPIPLPRRPVSSPARVERQTVQETFIVQVPKNSPPGSGIIAIAPNGDQVHVIVPEGSAPGSLIPITRVVTVYGSPPSTP